MRGLLIFAAALALWISPSHGLTSGQRALLLAPFSSGIQFFYAQLNGVSGNPTVVTGGSGNHVGDLLTVQGGTPSGWWSQAVFQVTSVSGGAVTGAITFIQGNYTTAPSNPVTAGNATFNATFAPSSGDTFGNGNFADQSDATAIRWNSIDPRQNVGSSGLFGNANYIGVHTTNEFVTTSSQINLYILEFTNVFDVYVNEGGDKAGLGTFIGEFSGTASGAPSMLAIKWPTAKPRKVYVYGINYAISGAGYSNDGTLKTPTYSRPPIAYFLGDSYTEGTGANSLSTSWANVLCAIKGWECVQSGIGGAGWLSTGANLPNTRVTNDLADRTHAPQKIINAMGFNDVGGNMTTLASQLSAAVTTQKAGFPTATIYCLGPWTPLGETAGEVTVKTTIQSACTSAGGTFVDISGIFTAGNSFLIGPDNTHPTQEGHNYLGTNISPLLNFLLKRDVYPAANDNTPMFLNQAA